MKDYNTQINYNFEKAMLRYASENDCTVIEQMGALDDFYAICLNMPSDMYMRYNGHKMKGRKYAVLYYKYFDAMSNLLHLLLTDSYNKVVEMAKDYGCCEEDIEYLPVL